MPEGNWGGSLLEAIFHGGVGGVALCSILIGPPIPA